MRGCSSTGPRRRTISATPSRSCVSGAERFERPYDSRELANLHELDGLAPPLLFGGAILIRGFRADLGRQAARQLTRVAGPKLVEARRTVTLASESF